MTATVHIRRTIVVEYDVDREDYEDGAGVAMTDANIVEAESDCPPWDIWPDLGESLVTSHTTEVTFR